jgi:hypothetical protein
MSIKVLDTINALPILQEYEKLKDQVEWVESPHGKQSALQHLKDRPSCIDACGTLNSEIYKETDFNQINSIISNTKIEELIHKYKMYRTRLMIVKPKSCYTLHKDFGPRIHIPLITNPSAMFVFLKDGLTHLQIGKVYWVDTTKLHSFANFGLTDRLHIIGCI